MAKRESSMSALPIDPNTGAALSAVMDPPKPKKPKKPRVRPDLPYVRGTFLVPRGTYERIHELARKRHTTFQGILQELVDDWLASQGEPPFFPAGWDGWNPPKKEQTA